MAGSKFLEPMFEGKGTTTRNRIEIIKERFEQLPEADRSLFQNGSFILALNASLCGLISNSLFRRLLNVTQAPVASGLPMLFIPFFSTLVTFEASVKQPLIEGNLNCATCAMVRGGLIGGFIGGLYSALTALPLNAALASRYSTSPMPSKENFWQYWKTICKPVLKKMKFAFLLQVAFGTYLSSQHHKIYIKMLQLPEPGRDPEEINE
ncbi:transmembrane protein 126A-like [Elgaria multicarinata webbii]|uniref:transmembrane protein 126A-like n=1 Tax=Elgaria multicarinata webbii TaxID=159646 RepID=UPI002FCD4539